MGVLRKMTNDKKYKGLFDIFLKARIKTCKKCHGFKICTPIEKDGRENYVCQHCFQKLSEKWA